MSLPKAFTKASRLLRDGRWLDATLALQKGWVRGALASVAPSARPPLRKARSQGPPGFALRSFGFGGLRWRYRLFEPVGRTPAHPLPLLVMLHGCKQDALDFAEGTGMNEIAQREGLLVLYPEQRRKSNGYGCWNWFEPAHQGAAAGEPAMLAALVRQTAVRWNADPARIFVAGLSAGGAMATLLGDLYPDLFAAVGVHSGLPPRSANDVRSAFTAMRRGLKQPWRTDAAVATIVFHGDADDTVVFSNGHAILQAQVDAHQGGGSALRRFQTREHGLAGARLRPSDRVRWIEPGGRTVVEHWAVGTGPHAWSGGHASGSFTDPRGPSASEAMVRFFLQQAAPAPAHAPPPVSL
jgi:poly(hydroxyalkanoate) depolymerase family esterase